MHLSILLPLGGSHAPPWRPHPLPRRAARPLSDSPSALCALRFNPFGSIARLPNASACSSYFLIGIPKAPRGPRQGVTRRPEPVRPKLAPRWAPFSQTVPEASVTPKPRESKRRATAHPQRPSAPHRSPGVRICSVGTDSWPAGSLKHSATEIPGPYVGPASPEYGQDPDGPPRSHR